MNGSLIVLVPLVVFGVVALFGFVGCTKFAALEDHQAAPPVAAAKQKYSDLILAEGGLVAYWRLSEASGSAMDDSAPTKHPGVYELGATPGRAGALRLGNDSSDLAVHFDGVKGHGTVTFHPSLNPPLKFSVEAWVKPELVAATGYGVVSSFETANPIRGYSLAVVRLANGQTHARVTVGEGAASATLEVPLGAPTPTGWFHLVATYERQGVAASLVSKLRLFVNGVQDPSGELPTTAKPDQIDYQPVAVGSTTPVLVGCLSTAGVPNRFFSGDIDEVALYNIALDVTKVKAHFDAASAT